jgi:hypothetical protein
MSSRKDYRAVAALISERYACAAPFEQHAVQEMARGLARIFSDDNPRFSVQRFYAACACGLED